MEIICKLKLNFSSFSYNPLLTLNQTYTPNCHFENIIPHLETIHPSHTLHISWYVKNIVKNFCTAQNDSKIGKNLTELTAELNIH